MLKIFKKRWFVVTLGLTFLALFIWFAGPYFAFADFHPLAPWWARLLLILLVLAIYFGGALLKKLKAISASAKLAKAVAKPAPQAGQADTDQLRERFAEAVANLKQGSKGQQTLYDLPWYVIIGAPGSGKTTALVNSGLRFPLEQKFGKGAVRGVGGTRNCDWWFTDEAVLLDTAGRYTTQDSDQSADSAGWTEFLKLLLQYRKRRPLNGIIVALSASDLLTQHAAERQTHIAAVRRRLDEINRQLKVQLPVYVLVTKCDLLAGFAEYFDELNQEGRKQVWGMTFSADATRDGQAAASFPAEFSALARRLNERLLDRVEAERDTRRRAAIFGFPQQFAGIGEPLRNYIDEVFAPSRHDGRVLLRGIYFTSGTQEGTPLDRLLGSLGRALAPGAENVSRSGGRGKSYFIESLLRDVLFAESGLAGVNKAEERRQLIVQTASYAAVLLLVVFGIIAFSVSYQRNRAYIADVTAAADQLRDIAVTPQSTLLQVLPRLDEVRAVLAVADRHKDAVPLSMRWGLYQGNAVGNATSDAYLRELNSLLLPRASEAIRQRMIGYAADPETLYEYLKTYLMFGQPEHIQKGELRTVVDLEFAAAFANDPDVRKRLSEHFAYLLDHQDSLRPLSIDMNMVGQARNVIKQASIAKVMYAQMKLQYLGDVSGAVRLDADLGLGAQKILVRKSGQSLAEPIPALYTPATFKKITGLGRVELVKQLTTDRWVLGDDLVSAADAPQLIDQVLAAYEQDYIRVWDQVLSDVQVAPFGTVRELVDGLAIVAGPASPLRALYATVDKNTYLTPPPDGMVGKLDKAQQALKDRLGNLIGSNSTAAAPQGSTITNHFAALHQMLDASSGQAPIDRVLAQIGQVQQKLQGVGTNIGEVSALQALTQSGSGDSIKALQQQAATLPPSLASLVTQIAGTTESAAVSQARTELMNLYTSQVVKPCSEVIARRYPFDAASKLDVPLADFGRIFGGGGVFDAFFTQHLQSLVDTSRSPWVWRSSTTGSLGLPRGILRQFEQAQQIRDAFFRPGGQLPELHFNVTANALDANATRVTFEFDGQSFEYRHGPERTLPTSWPGPSPGVAAISFEDRGGGRPNKVFQGPWALFRLLDAAAVQKQSDVRFLATWQAGAHEASYLLEATSVRNPFGNANLRRFSCGA